MSSTDAADDVRGGAVVHLRGRVLMATAGAVHKEKWGGREGREEGRTCRTWSPAGEPAAAVIVQFTDRESSPGAV